jgi:hypothetical protein
MSMQAQDAEYFGDTRDYWWNLDFLELMGKRLSLDGADEPNESKQSVSTPMVSGFATNEHFCHRLLR